MKRLIFFVTLLLTACNDDYYIINNLIDSFYIPIKPSSDYYISNDSTIIALYLCYNSKNDQTTKYKYVHNDKAYSEYYGDTHLNLKQKWHNKNELSGDLKVSKYACAIPIKSITISADIDIDERHKTDESLNDIVRIQHLVSYYKYIKSDYKDTYLRHDIYCSLNDCTTDDFCLLENRIVFSIPTPNVTADTVTYTISIDFDKDPVTGEEISVEPVKVKVAYNTAE